MLHCRIKEAGRERQENKKCVQRGLSRIMGCVQLIFNYIRYYLFFKKLQWELIDIVSNKYVKYFVICRINANSKGVRKSRLALKKAVSTKRKFDFQTEDRIAKLKEVELKKRVQSQVDWAVGAYIDWRDERLFTYNYDFGIYMADLRNLEELTKENLCYSLCRFLPEVTKQRGEGDYPGRTLYQMLVAIQKYLNVNKIFWKLVEGPDFLEARTVLDNISKERTKANMGVVRRQASVISYEMENLLWDKGILGEDKPEKLRNTVLFLLGINLLLRAVDEHYYLCREMPTERSQLQFECNESGTHCLVFHEDSWSKTHNGGLKDMKCDRKVVWVYPNPNVKRCTVRLLDKYLGLCPRYYSKSNLYLQALQKPKPNQWYGEQVIGSNNIAKIVTKLMEEANIPGLFTNHSLHRSGGTRLFRAGVQKKLIKEVSGHRSDAIYAYEITSDEQRQCISAIIAKDPEKHSVVEEKLVKNCENVVIKEPQFEKTEPSESKCGEVHVPNEEINASNVGEIVSKILKANTKKGKTVLRLEFEFHNE